MTYEYLSGSKTMSVRFTCCIYLCVCFGGFAQFKSKIAIAKSTAQHTTDVCIYYYYYLYLYVHIIQSYSFGFEFYCALLRWWCIEAKKSAKDIAIYIYIYEYCRIHCRVGQKWYTLGPSNNNLNTCIWQTRVELDG